MLGPVVLVLTSLLFHYLFIWTQFFEMPFADLDALTRCFCFVDRHELTVHKIKYNAGVWRFGSHAGTVRYGGTPDSFFVSRSTSFHTYKCALQCICRSFTSSLYYVYISTSLFSIAALVSPPVFHHIFLLRFKFVGSSLTPRVLNSFGNQFTL